MSAFKVHVKHVDAYSLGMLRFLWCSYLCWPDTGSLVSCLADLYVTLPWSSVELSDDSTRWWTAADDDGGPGWKAVNEWVLHGRQVIAFADVYKDVETSKCIDSKTSVHLWRWQRAAAAAAWLNGNQTIYSNKITSRFLSSSLLPGTTVEIKLSEKTFTRILCQNVYVCAR